ncbi:MAG: hypothetical protein LBB66_07270 [Desulfovibrio sp.]|jgi:hypothetical protein|nr:hypothetical protein [Desulfovibrio sp.]
MKYRALVQEERHGCGIAVAAVLAGISYEQSRRIANALNIFAGDRALWSDTKCVRRLLAHHGITAGATEIPFTSWEALPELALLALKWRLIDGRPHWHWAVFARDQEARVLDSSRKINKPVRRDFGRMKPKWFIPLTPAG